MSERLAIDGVPKIEEFARAFAEFQHVAHAWPVADRRKQKAL